MLWTNTHVFPHGGHLMGDAVSQNKGIPTAGFNPTRQHLHCGRLSGSIVPEKCSDLATVHIDREPVNGCDVLSVHFSEAFDGDSDFFRHGTLVAFGHRRSHTNSMTSSMRIGDEGLQLHFMI